MKYCCLFCGYVSKGKSYFIKHYNFKIKIRLYSISYRSLAWGKNTSHKVEKKTKWHCAVMYGFIFMQKSDYRNLNKQENHNDNSCRLRMWRETGKLLKINEEAQYWLKLVSNFKWPSTPPFLLKIVYRVNHSATKYAIIISNWKHDFYSKKHSILNLHILQVCLCTDCAKIYRVTQNHFTLGVY
jgi:hypothetical protein